MSNEKIVNAINQLIANPELARKIYLMLDREGYLSLKDSVYICCHCGYVDTTVQIERLMDKKNG